MGFTENPNPKTAQFEGDDAKRDQLSVRDGDILPSNFVLTAKIEPFDSFWEAPDDIEKGYGKFSTFYKHNYLNQFPADKNSRILNISCGPGYMVRLLSQNDYKNVTGIDAMPEKVVWAKSKNINCEPLGHSILCMKIRSPMM